MHEPRTLAADTTPEAERIQVAMWRAMTPAQKFARFLGLRAAVQSIAEAGIRMRHPEADAREVFLRRASMTLDRATMLAVYGWDPAARP